MCWPCEFNGMWHLSRNSIKQLDVVTDFIIFSLGKWSSMGKGNNRVDGRSIHFYLEKKRICVACYRAGWRGFCYSGYEEELKKEILGNETNNVHANALGRQGAARAGGSKQSTATDMQFKHTSSKRKNQEEPWLKTKRQLKSRFIPFKIKYLSKCESITIDK